MRIYDDGAVTKPHHPCFAAKGSASWISMTTTAGDIDIAMGTELFDVGGHYNNSTYTFTAPVDGKYFFYVQVYFKLDSASGYFSNYFTKNNATAQENHSIWSYSNDAPHLDQTQTQSCIMDLSANDYVRFRMNAEGDHGDIYGGHCLFSGYLIC